MLNPTGLSDALLFCTSKITITKNDNKKSYGTGFIYQILLNNHHCYYVLVTNKHVIKNAKEGDFEVYGANQDGTPNGKFAPFVINDFEKQWILHPNDKIDLCALIINPDDVFKELDESLAWRFSSLTERMIAQNLELRTLRTVEEVLMVGYPDGQNEPISHYPLIRKGTTALHPGVNYRNLPMGILDIPSFPGSSGSPIFLYNQGIYDETTVVDIDKRLVLLGVLSDCLTSDTGDELSESEKYYLDLGIYIKASEIFVLAEEVKRVAIERG